MIQARFIQTNDLIVSFELSGHAGYSVAGQDIVCAAVSALAINTINSLEQLLNVQPLIETDDENQGYLYVELKKEDIARNQVQLLLASLKLGLYDIEQEYPKYLKIVK